MAEEQPKVDSNVDSVAPVATNDVPVLSQGMKDAPVLGQDTKDVSMTEAGVCEISC